MQVVSQIKNLFVTNRFFHFGFLLTSLHILGGALGYVYQILMGRILHPSEFALLSAIMGFFMFASAPLGAMSLLIVRKVATLKAYNELNHVRSIFFQLNKIIIFSGIFALPVFWFAKSPLQHYLKIDDSNLIVLLFTLFIFSIFNVAGFAFLQGLQRFVCLGILGLSGVFIKIVISYSLIKNGMGVTGALLGSLLSMVTLYIMAILILFTKLPQQRSHHQLRLTLSTFQSALPVLLATTVFAAMTQLDVVIVNWYFSPLEAGQYAAASVLGKAILYLPGGLVLALFPMVSEDYAKGSEGYQMFRQAVGLTLLLCGIIALIYWFFGDLIISILYGKNYAGAGEILRWYGICIIPLSVVFIAEHYLIAKRKVLFTWLFFMIIPLQLFFIGLWHQEIWMILVIIGGFGLFLASLGCFLIYRSSKFI